MASCSDMAAATIDCIRRWTTCLHFPLCRDKALWTLSSCTEDAIWSQRLHRNVQGMPGCGAVMSSIFIHSVWLQLTEYPSTHPSPSKQSKEWKMAVQHGRFPWKRAHDVAVKSSLKANESITILSVRWLYTNENTTVNILYLISANTSPSILHTGSFKQTFSRINYQTLMSPRFSLVRIHRFYFSSMIINGKCSGRRL